MMKMAVLILVGLAVATPAYASCRDELADLKLKVQRQKTTDAARYTEALKWYNKAMQVEPASEVDCHNNMVRSRKALAGNGPDMLAKKANQVPTEKREWQKTYYEEKRSEGAWHDPPYAGSTDATVAPR